MRRLHQGQLEIKEGTLIPYLTVCLKFDNGHRSYIIYYRRLKKSIPAHQLRAHQAIMDAQKNPTWGGPN